MLKAALGTFARGDASVTLQDWYAEGTPQRTIELDPRLGPKENVERIFTRYHKLVDAGERRRRARPRRLAPSGTRGPS